MDRAFRRALYSFSGDASVKRRIRKSAIRNLSTRLHEGQITKVVVRPDLIHGTSQAPDGKPEKFPHDSSERSVTLVDDLERNKVRDYSGEPDRSWFGAVIMNFGPALVCLFFWFLMIRQMQGGGKQAMAFGRSRRQSFN